MPANIPGLNLGGQDPKWIDAYYNDYVTQSAAVGATPLSEDAYYAKYYGGGEINFEGIKSASNKDLMSQGIDAYNTAAQKLASATGGQYNPYSGNTTDFNNIANQLKNVNSQVQYAYTTYSNAATKAGATPLSQSDWMKNPTPYTATTPTTTSATNITLPSELTTVEDWANSQMNVSAPTFDPAAVASWQKTLDPITQNAKDTMKSNASDAFAALFPNGGGSTYEASKLADALQGIDDNTLAQATEYAQADQNQKYSTWEGNQATAKNELAGIADYKANQANFATQQDATNYWNKVASDWTQQSYYDTQSYNNEAYNLNATLAQNLAQEQANASSNSNPWTNIIPSLINAGGKIASAAILS